MLDSWVVSTNTTDTIQELNVTENNHMNSRGDLSKQVQYANSEHNWVFFGMAGFTDKNSNKKLIK